VPLFRHMVLIEDDGELSGCSPAGDSRNAEWKREKKSKILAWKAWCLWASKSNTLSHHSFSQDPALFALCKYWAAEEKNSLLLFSESRIRVLLQREFFHMRSSTPLRRENHLVMDKFHCSWFILPEKSLPWECKHIDESCSFLPEIMHGNGRWEFE
jgi:hypothetical protein